MMVSKRNLLFQGLLFRFHVKFLGCKAEQKVNTLAFVFFLQPHFLACFFDLLVLEILNLKMDGM